jgi:hypothetical protein
MSVPELSSTGTIAPAQQSDVGGTSFLDLPLELREMIYDLCAPKRFNPFLHLPFQSKPVIAGINLLLSSKQIQAEVSQRLNIWTSIWILKIQSCTPSVGPITLINCPLAMSGLHDLALAKIRTLGLQFEITTYTPVISGIHGLESLLKLKSLYVLTTTLTVKSDRVFLKIKDLNELMNLPFITGFVIHVLSHIPTSVKGIGWYFYASGVVFEGGGNITLGEIAERYKSVRGSAYTSQPEQ